MERICFRGEILEFYKNEDSKTAALQNKGLHGCVEKIPEY